MKKKVSISYLEQLAELKPEYLSSLNQKKLLRPVSVILTTYNRCPNLNPHLNPLAWAIQSLQQQVSSLTTEIIVVDDGSTDYTERTITEIAMESLIRIRYFKNENNQGMSLSRNLALKMAKEDLIFLMDDDCILPRHCLFGLNYSLERFQAENNLAVIHPPVYYRSTFPRKLIPRSEIGILDADSAIMTSNFNCFPEEAARELVEGNPRYLDQELRIFNPIEVSNLMGVFLAEKKVLLQVGGFPTYFTWRNGYTEESELGFRIKEAGYSAAFLFDPKFQAVHLRYGFIDQEVLRGDDWKEKDELSLEQMVRISNKDSSDNGCRVENDEWARSKILSKYVLFGIRSETGARVWQETSYREFVTKNNPAFYSYQSQRIDDKERRKKIWQEAIIEGNILLSTMREMNLQQKPSSITPANLVNEYPISYAK